MNAKRFLSMLFLGFILCFWNTKALAPSGGFCNGCLTVLPGLPGNIYDYISFGACSWWNGEEYVFCGTTWGCDGGGEDYCEYFYFCSPVKGHNCHFDHYPS